MHPNFQMTAYPGDRGGADSSVISRALIGQSSSNRWGCARDDGRIMAAAIKAFIANRSLLQYRTRTEIHFFCAQSLALELNRSHSRGSMNMKWRLQ
jgi:hypothetical protein